MENKNEKTAAVAEKDTKEAKKLESKAVDVAAEDNSDEINTDELFKHRKSINLTTENSKFTLSQGGMISLKIINDEGEEEFFERIVIRRSFPITSPNEFLSVREPDTKAKGRGHEIGMIRDLSNFDGDTVKLIQSELDIRYFTPELKKILSAKEKFGYHYWEIETTAGTVSIVIGNPYTDIRVLEDKRIFIYDLDGNCFVIPNPSKLDKQSFKYIEIYI